MPIERARVENLFDAFVDALLDKDFDRAVQWCDQPCTIVRPTGPSVCDAPAQAAQDLETFWTSYNELGICGLRRQFLDMRSYAEGVLLADVEWRLVDQNGLTAKTLHSTYGLRDTGDALKVMLILGHDEIFQRPMGPSPFAAHG